MSAIVTICNCLSAFARGRITDEITIIVKAMLASPVIINYVKANFITPAKPIVYYEATSAQY